MGECKRVKQVIDDLNKYDYLAKEHDYIVVTAWANGEGYDIDVNGEHRISLTDGMLRGIQYLVNKLEYDFEEK